MKEREVPQHGSRGKVTASRNRFGQFKRERVSPNQPGTAAQRDAWSSMTELSRLWNELSNERRTAWRRLAEETDSRPTLSQSGKLDGCQLFKKINRVLATCGRAPLLDPPSLPDFPKNPVTGFTIKRVRGKLALMLQLSPETGVDASPALQDLMVYAWAPYNAGADKNDLWAFIGLLHLSKTAEIDITALYLKKLKEWRKLKHKRYHIPLEGSRIFIRVWQQIDGWENEVGMFRASALVPADPDRFRVTPRRYARKMPDQ
jgi:hypothetical protein